MSSNSLQQVTSFNGTGLSSGTTLGANQITIDEDGIYLVEFNVSGTISGGTNQTGVFTVAVNGVQQTNLTQANELVVPEKGCDFAQTLIDLIWYFLACASNCDAMIYKIGKIA